MFEDNIALIEKEKSITYREFKEMIMEYCSDLESRVLVFIMTQNCIDSVVFYAGCIEKRIVPLLLHNELKSDKLNHLLQQYLPQYLILPQTYTYMESAYKLSKLVGRYKVLKRERKVEYMLHKDLALLLSTSGSSGSPKCVKISYENLSANTKDICTALNITEKDRAITTLPMDYTYGLSIINTHLYQHASIVLNEYSIISEKFWNELRNHRCNNFGGVPFIYETIIKLNLLKYMKGLKYVTQAGGSLNCESINKLLKFCAGSDIEFIVMYGQTEATARMTILPAKDCEKHLGSVGLVIPNGNIKIITEKNKEIKEPYIEGELVYEGKNVTLGYAQSWRDLERGDENKSILHTGDIGYRDEENFYYIVGRKKRIIKILGERFNLDEIEHYLKGKGYFVACLEVNQKLFIVFENNVGNEIKKELIKYGINGNFITLKSIEEIPLTESKKTNYSLLKKLMLGEKDVC